MSYQENEDSRVHHEEILLEPCFVLLLFFQAHPVCQNFSLFRNHTKGWVFTEFSKHWVLQGGQRELSSLFPSQVPDCITWEILTEIGLQNLPTSISTPPILTASFFILHKAKHQMPLTEFILLIKKLSGTREHERLILLYFRYQTWFSCLLTENPNYELFDEKNITFCPFYLLWFPCKCSDVKQSTNELMRHSLIKKNSERKKVIKRKFWKQKQTENVISVDITFLPKALFSLLLFSTLKWQN